jgi:hypothetical protein
MEKPELEAIPVTGLEVVSNQRDLRRDLHLFIRYVRDREIKRTHRENQLPKTDALRLAALAGDAAARKDIEESGSSAWIDHLDRLARLLGFIGYDTKGQYLGMQSTSPSFPDNFITFHEEAYQKHLRKPPQGQEEALLAALLEGEGEDSCEFFQGGPLGRLDRFDIWGSRTGVLPALSFPTIRRRLLEFLVAFPAGSWFSTASLVEVLKRKDRFFLIPEVLAKELLQEGKDRYKNFHEVKDGRSWEQETITERTPRAFERVEGRYLERFLEGIPLELGYVEVAYGKGESDGRRPSRGELQAFRLTERFRLALRKEIPAARLVVLPNFEVHVDSPFYPASEVDRLLPLGELVSEGPHTVLKLERVWVAAAAAEGGPDAALLLEELASEPLPGNVLAELESWVGRSDTFTLYDGFGLLEEPAGAGTAGRFLVERVSPSVAIVRAPGELFRELEKADRVPVRLRHADGSLQKVPAGCTTVFPRAEIAEGLQKGKRERRLILKRTARFTINFPDAGMLEAFRKALLDRKRVLPAGEKALSVTYSRKDQAFVEEALKSLKPGYDFKVEDE